MEIEKIINEVFAKTKKRLEADDPLFVLVAMNEVVLDEYLASATEEIQVAAREIELQTGMNIEKITVIEKRIEEIRGRTGEFIKAQAQLEIESAKVEIRAAAKSVLAETTKQIANEMNAHISKSIDSQMVEHVRTVKKAEAELVGSLEKAQGGYSSLLKSINSTKERLADIQPNSKWESLIYGLVGGCIGGIAISVAISYGGIHVDTVRLEPTAINKNK